MCAKCWNQCKTWSDFKALALDSERQLGGMIKKEVDEEAMDEGDPLEYFAEVYSIPQNEEDQLADPSFCEVVGSPQKVERNTSPKGVSPAIKRK